MTLANAPVNFDQEQHRYFLTTTGEELRGVTGTLLRHIFPDMYAGVPASTLAAAAGRGSLVHQDIELSITLGTEPATPEGRNFGPLVGERDIIASEYLVTDMQHFASSIDVVLSGSTPDSVVLADIKTTQKLHRDCVAWQLSIYAAFFEQLNPGIHVEGLQALWLRGEDIADAVSLPRYSARQVAELVEAYLNGRPYEWQPATPAYIGDCASQIHYLSSRIAAMQTQLDEAKLSAMRAMQEHGDSSLDFGDMLLTVTRGGTRKSFDSAAFRKAHAELYREFQTEKKTAPSLRVTLRDTTDSKQQQ